MQLLQVGLIFGDTIARILTIKDFWSVRIKVIVYKQYKETASGAEDFYIDLLAARPAKMATSCRMASCALEPPCTVVMEGFYSGPGDIFHAWPTHAVVKRRRLGRKKAHEKSQTLVFCLQQNWEIAALLQYYQAPPVYAATLTNL